MSVCVLGHIQLFATPWTVARQVPLSMGFSRQEYWSGLPFPSPGDFSHLGIKPGSPALQAEPPGNRVAEIVHWHPLHRTPQPEGQVYDLQGASSPQ